MPHVRGFCKSLSILISLVLFFIGCASVQKTEPPVQNQEVSSLVNESARNLEKSKSYIETGMLDSLVSARKLLLDNNLENTEQGRELDYIASSFMSLVYPYYKQTAGTAAPLKSSIFPSITSAVKAGHIPDISETDTTFFTLMFSAAAVFYTNAPDVLDRCHEIAIQLESFSSNNLYAKLIEAKILEIQIPGDITKSFDLYSQIIVQEPDCYPAQIGIAGIYIKRKKYASAIDILEKQHALYPDGKDISGLLVESYLDTQQIEKANTLLEEVLSRDPNDIDLALQRARLLMLTGQADQAGKLVSIFESEKGETDKSFNLRVLLLIQKGSLQKAGTLLKKGLVKYPGDIILQITYGKLLLEMKQFETAENYLSRQIKKNKNDPDLLRLLVKSYIDLRQWKKASPLIERLLQLDPGDEVLRYAVEVSYERGEIGKALVYNKKLLSGAHPSMVDYYYRVKLLLAQGNKKGAMTELDTWLKTARTPEKRSLLYYYMSLCTDKPDQQKDFLQKALFENLQNLKALLALAELYEKQGEYRKAYRYLKQASIMDPEDSETKNKLRKLEKEL